MFGILLVSLTLRCVTAPNAGSKTLYASGPRPCGFTLPVSCSYCNSSILTNSFIPPRRLALPGRCPRLSPKPKLSKTCSQYFSEVSSKFGLVMGSRFFTSYLSAFTQVHFRTLIHCSCRFYLQQNTPIYYHLLGDLF